MTPSISCHVCRRKIVGTYEWIMSGDNVYRAHPQCAANWREQERRRKERASGDCNVQRS